MQNTSDIIKPFEDTTGREIPTVRGLRISDCETKYDEACKRLLSEKPILTQIIKATMPKCQNCDASDIIDKYIEDAPEISAVPAHPDGKGYYITFPLYDGESEQSHCEDVQKAYAVWICLDPPQERKNTAFQYRLIEKHFGDTIAKPIKSSDLLVTTTFNLGDPDKAERSSALRMLDVLFSGKIELQEKKRILQDEFGIAITEAIEKSVSDMYMCSLPQDVLDKSRIETLTESVRNLIKTTGWTLEQAMDALCVTSADREICQKLFQQQPL